MPKYVTLLVIILTCFSLTTSCTGQNVDSNIETAFTNVNLVPMDSAHVLKDQTVLIKDGVISEFGPSARITIPDGIQVIDGEGNYLMPGLTDFHIHLRSTDELISYLAYGVTTVVHMSGATSGAPDLLTYKKKLANGEMIGPQLFTTGPILDGDPPIFGGVSIGISSPEEARRIVREQKQKGYDFIKVYNNLTPELLKAITDESKDQGMAVIGHIPRKGGRDKALQRALNAGMDMIAHGEEYFFTYFYNEVDSLLNQGKIPYPDEKEIPYLIKLTKEAGIAVTPNLSFVAMTRKQLDSLEVVLSDPETSYLSPEVLEMWEEQNPTKRSDLERFNTREIAKYDFLKKLTKALEDGGVPLLLGTDASAPGLFPGKSAHLELHELVKTGLTPFEALITGTNNAGKFMNENATETKRFGVIKAGYQADLILVKGNPLENISNVSKIMGVMEGGEWFSSEELTQMREEIAQKYNR